LPATAPTTASPAIAIVYQVATKRGEASIQKVIRSLDDQKVDRLALFEQPPAVVSLLPDKLADQKSGLSACGIG
jgi:hypothetical protein